MNFVDSCREQNKDILNRYINEHEDFNISLEMNKLMIQNELDIIKWLYSIDPRVISTVTKVTILEIVKNRHFVLLEWLQEKNIAIHTMVWNILKEIIFELN